MDSNSFPVQPMASGTVQDGLAIFSGTRVGLGQQGSAVTSFDWEIFNPQWVAPVAYAIAAAPTVRCDNALGGGTTSGCTLPGYTPTMVYSLSGPYPQLAEHIAFAQASGLAGAPGGLPLYRTQDTNINRLNSSNACPSSLPRPAGFECDEYPFASTYEGAYEEKYVYAATARTWSWCQINLNAPNSTGPYGWSICMIDETQNGNGGLALQEFYYGDRVLDGDTFYTQITS